MNEHLSRSNRNSRSRNTGKRTRRMPEREASETDMNASYPELAYEPALKESGEDELLDLNQLPTRKDKFPSQRIKLTRWFYNSLLYIFIAILITLLWWGISDSPWGKGHGL